jgi:uncharacterized protein
MRFRDRDIIDVTPTTQTLISSFTARVYGWMTVGLFFTGMVALGLYASGLFVKMLPFWWVWALGTFGVAMAISFLVRTLSPTAMAVLFMAYSGMQGMFFGTVLPGFAYAYGGGVIWSAFGTASLLFGIAALYGIITRSDLTRFSRILTIGLIGLMAVSLLYFVLSFFVQVTWLQLLISYVGLIIFVGLTAYDAQQIRSMAMQVGGQSAIAHKLSLIMALRMYVNVVMIFWYLLQIFAASSGRRSS